MTRKELLLRNPLDNFTQEGRLQQCAFGAVLAPSGAGKTAILVQLALSAMLQSRNVVHVSLNQSIDKVQLWYDELFADLSRTYPSLETAQVLEESLPHRFIMTFKVEGFSVPKLEERLTDLVDQNIFRPRMLIIDGCEFGADARDFLLEVKQLAAKFEMSAWFTVRTHRHEAPDHNGMPPAFAPVGDLFDLILQLENRGTDTIIRPLKGIAADSNSDLMTLDPVTLLISPAEG